MRVRLVLLFATAICVTAPIQIARAQDANSAKLFVESLYKLYTKNSHGVPFAGARSRLYYHSSLLALMRADEKAVDGEVGALDGDPICSCQDWEGIWDLHVDTQPQSADRAVANVSFALHAPAGRKKEDMRRLVMTLAAENGQWRIWDIRDVSDPKNAFDVRDALQAEIKQLSKPAKAAAKH